MEVISGSPILMAKKVLRLTSTPAVESNPAFPRRKWIAFNSNRSGIQSVYIVPVEGGSPKKAQLVSCISMVCGWTPDRKRVLYSTSRDNTPSGIARLWTVSIDGGPSTPVSSQWGFDGSYSPDGSQIVIDRIQRWDVEWRHYRGGQNTPLVILNLADQAEKLLPNESTIDIQPLWLAVQSTFCRIRQDFNIWSYATPQEAEADHPISGPDTKWLILSGFGNKLAFERDGYLHLLDLLSKESKQLNITINADFPWAETKWQDVTGSAANASLSPTGKRVLMEARGEIFTIPAEFGDARNITNSSGAADHAPIWSPKEMRLHGSLMPEERICLVYALQDGLKPRSIPIGESKMAWEPAWSPDGKLAFVDDKSQE
jgi:tricorn protease